MQLFPLVNNTNEGQEKFHYQKIFLPFSIPAVKSAPTAMHISAILASIE